MFQGDPDVSALAWNNREDPVGSDPLLIPAHLPDPTLKKELTDKAF